MCSRVFIGCLVVCIGVLAESFSLALVPGWNLVSVPLAPDDPRPEAVFGGAAEGTVWSYDAARACYAEAEAVEPGCGYWVYVPVASGRDKGAGASLTVVGKTVRRANVSLTAGWNLLGPIGGDPYGELPVPLRTESGVRGEVGPVWIWHGTRYEAAEAVACGVGAWVRTADAATVRVTPDPVFAGALLAYSPAVGTVRAHWPEADDDWTASEDMRYRVYAAPSGVRGDELISDSHLAATVVGGTQVALSGLTPGTRYEVAVVAEDAVGNRSQFCRRALAVPVMARANDETLVPRDLGVEGFEIVELSADGSLVTLADSRDLAVGDLVVFDNPDGVGLRRVATVVRTVAGDELTTEAACLAQAMPTGVVHSAAAIGALDGLGAFGAGRDGALTYGDPAGVFTVASELGEGADFADGRSCGQVSFGDGLTIDYSVGFRPAVETEVSLRDAALESCRVVAAGQFDLTMRADCDIAEALSVASERKLFGVSESFSYRIGSLPVRQEVGMDFYAAVEVVAPGPVAVAAVCEANQAVRVGVEYVDGGWQTLGSEDFAQNVTLDVESGGAVLATVKVYPVVWTRFYSSPVADLSFEPSLRLDAEVRSSQLPVETTKFDGDFVVGAGADADVGVFAADTPEAAAEWTMAEAAAFSLPEVGFVAPPGSISIGVPTAFMLHVEDGVNNPVSADGIEWWVEPTGGRLRDVAAWIAPREGEFAVIPGGTNSGVDPDFGLYSLTVQEFRMGTCEVSKATWDTVRAWGLANGYTDLPAGGGKGDDHPVHSVSWRDVVKWCNARSEMEGRSPCYYIQGTRARVINNRAVPEIVVSADGRTATVTAGQEGEYELWVSVRGDGGLGEFGRRYARTVLAAVEDGVWRTGEMDDVECDFGSDGYRLPTNDEWEYCARGGLAGKRFPWGDTVTHHEANYKSDASYSYDEAANDGYHPDYSVGATPYSSPVGAFQANGYGLFDMAGNMWEWCWDWSAGRAGSDRVVCGGSWLFYATGCRVGASYSAPSSMRYDQTGFRICFSAAVR